MGDQSKFLEEICVVTTELRVAAASGNSDNLQFSSTPCLTSTCLNKYYLNIKKWLTPPSFA
jgi:hypothetical protein